MYPIGTTLKVDSGIAGIIHYGIADGFGRVVHCSKRRYAVVIELESVFANGREVKVAQSITSDDPQAAVEKAKNCIGGKYDLFADNCEHFVRHAHGMVVESPQLQQASLAVVGGTLVAKSDDAVIENIGYGITLGALCTPADQSPMKNAIVGGLIGGVIGFLLAKR